MNTAIRERINHAANGQLFPDEIDKLEALLQEVQAETEIKGRMSELHRTYNLYGGLPQEFLDMLSGRNRNLEAQLEALTRRQHGASE